jgi:hypothetical protein
VAQLGRCGAKIGAGLLRNSLALGITPFWGGLPYVSGSNLQTMPKRPLKHIPAVEITDTQTWDKPGSFRWLREWPTGEDIVGMSYLCPCGCGTEGEIRFARFGEVPRSPTFKWDGNREYPTIEPAFTHVVAGQTHWSGILQRGEWIGVTYDLNTPA